MPPGEQSQGGVHNKRVAILDPNGHLICERTECLALGDAFGGEPVPGNSSHDLHGSRCKGPKGLLHHRDKLDCLGKYRAVFVLLGPFAV